MIAGKEDDAGEVHGWRAAQGMSPGEVASAVREVTVELHDLQRLPEAVSQRGRLGQLLRVSR